LYSLSHDISSSYVSLVLAHELEDVKFCIQLRDDTLTVPSLLLQKVTGDVLLPLAGLCFHIKQLHEVAVFCEILPVNKTQILED
jgi:hypothetical protein